ncbi:patatin-like phospholipase family protein [Selenomonas sp. TAMA-11512]|uniref:patatin-like phospholipase family protein n=1 Tax=Selenomonas sp. TAMA-11512 TaxID=3095337 RepID=UPI0030CE3F62
MSDEAMYPQEKFGLIFAGGNGNLAFQLGACQAIVDAGLYGSVQAAAGASLGGLNALLFSLDELELAEKIWLERMPELVQNPPNKKLEKIYSLLQMSGLRNLSLEEFLARTQHGIVSSASFDRLVQGADFARVSLVRTCGLALTGFPNGEEMTVNVLSYPAEMRRVLLSASISLPVLSAPMHFADGRVYWDGVLTQPLPINMIYEEAGLRRIVVIHATPTSEIKTSDYPDADIVEIRPPMEEYDLPGRLDFTKQTQKRRIALGKQAMQEKIQSGLFR